VRSPLLHPDIFASLHQMLGSLAALLVRESSGEGSIVDLGQLECGVIAIFDQLAAAQGCAGPARAAPRLLRCAGEDQWLSVSPASEAEAQRADALGARAAQTGKGALAASLQAAGIACGEMLNADEVLQLDALKARDYFMRVDNDAFGPQLAIGRWHRFRGLRQSLGGVRRFAADNDAILRGTLGFADAEAARILGDGTVGPAPTDSPQPAAAGSPVDWMVRVRQIYRRDPDFRRKLGLERKP
jgi:crotonobetainyl-CoA:carnitine CoA-transferase CaiB-like acyl-CoA transferase